MKQESAEVDIYRLRTSVKGRMSGQARKSVNSVRVRGSGRPEKVGRPVVSGAPDVRKTPVVRWVGVNARCEFGVAILSGKWRFRVQNSRDFVDERWGNLGDARPT